MEGFRCPTWKVLRELIQCIRSMKYLEEFDLCGNMSIDNKYDVLVIANAIAGHPSLKAVRLQDFVVHAKDHQDTEPLLESLITAASSINQLEELHLRCLARYKQWNRAYLTCDAIVPFCLSTYLQRLALSNLGLEDEHLDAIGRAVAANPHEVAPTRP